MMVLKCLVNSLEVEPFILQNERNHLYGDIQNMGVIKGLCYGDDKQTEAYTLLSSTYTIQEGQLYSPTDEASLMTGHQTQMERT